MHACNVIRFRVRPGREQAFIDIHRSARAGFPGFLRGALVRTGDRTFCFIGEWQSLAQVHAAEPGMVQMLKRCRDTLEDLGGGLGVTDPVSGEVVVDLRPD
jgi:quinol monooxygenase YgiN